ncbi:MAG: hypothetical protein MI919_17810, partial [Holophagales bacterium]|nr:hypothetical protein [Holophagales bacterium]
PYFKRVAQKSGKDTFSSLYCGGDCCGGGRLGDPALPSHAPRRELLPAREGDRRRGLVALGPYRLRGDSRPRPYRLPRHGSLPPPTDSTPTTAIVLTCPLTGGVDRWVGALLAPRKAGDSPPSRRYAVALIPAEGPWPPHPLLELRPLTEWLLPVAPFAELGAGEPVGGGGIGPPGPTATPDTRAMLLAQALAHLGTDRILHLGPGKGFFGEPPIHLLLEARGVEVVDIPLTHLLGPEPAPARPPAVRQVGPLAEASPEGDFAAGFDGGVEAGAAVSGDGSSSSPALAGWPLPTGWPGAIPSRSRARWRLGLPDEERAGSEGKKPRIVAQICDLVPEEHPEAFVDLAHALRGRRDLLFLLVGRGPLEATIDARARLLGLRRFVRLASADDRAVIGAADLLCCTSPAPNLPWGPALALLAGRPVVVSSGRAWDRDSWREALEAGDLVLVDPEATPGSEALARAVETLLDRRGGAEAWVDEVGQPVAAHGHLLPPIGWRDRLFGGSW